MTSLLVDDFRDMAADIIARNYSSAIKVLINIPIDKLILDHDIGSDKNGYDILNFIFRPDIRIYPKEVVLITMNPVGRENMTRALENNNYKKYGGNSFYRNL